VTLTPEGDGTLVRLRHLDLPEQAREMHGQGWELYLGRLGIAAAGGDPGPDPNLRVVGGDYGTRVPLLTSPRPLSRTASPNRHRFAACSPTSRRRDQGGAPRTAAT
jgi:hypothetical protein